MSQRKWNARELGNFAHFEHVNFRVPDHYLATAFFIEGLGLTRDPTRMVSVRNMWVNAGQQQFHLPIGPAAPFAGEVGLSVPRLAEVKRSLRRVKPLLEETEFAVRDERSHLRVTSPWGHLLRVHPAGELSGRLPQAIPYVTFWVPEGTAEGIGRFYREVLGVPAGTRSAGKLRHTSVTVGVNQHFHFIEKRDLALTEHPNHVAVYLTRYGEVYAELGKRRLIMAPDQDEQFRFAKMVDPDSHRPLFEFEHEMRSLHHPDFLKPLVNRVSVPYLVD